MKQKDKRRKLRISGGNFDWFIFVLAGILVYFSWTAVSQQFRMNQIHTDYQAAQERLDAAKKENASLLKEKEKLNDPAYIEKIAREDLGMTKPGEMPYISPKK